MAVKFRDYYETLGVDRTAPANEIKKSFRKLARLYHPDVAKNKVTGEARFKEINEAYEVLSDPEKRRRYDELGPDWPEGAMGATPSGGSTRGAPHRTQSQPDFEFDGTGFSDFFESFFGARQGGFSSQGVPGGGARGREGQDVEADILVTLEEALRGSLRDVTLRRSSNVGERERTDRYRVRIPPGVREGQRIRLAGQGEEGSEGKAAGDLYLRVRLARHPDFSVQAADLYYELELAPWEAALGTKVTIPTLDRATALTVPPGTAANTALRLRGLGLPRENNTRGDLFATVQIRMPVTFSAEEKALWKQLSETSTFKPRG
jgi:curved DNA-binding protein